MLIVNPSRAVEPPVARRREFAVLNRQQVRRLCASCHLSRYGPLVHLALLTGMRRSELLGLPLSAVDVDGGVLRVVQALARVRGMGYELRPPKTARGRLAISLSPAAIELLRGVRAAQAESRLMLGAAYRDYGLVFTVPDGGAINPRNLHRPFKRLLQIAELPDVRFHDLRHTHATMLLEQNVHPKVVSERRR